MSNDDKANPNRAPTAIVPDWAPPGHYYSPIVNLGDIRQNHHRVFRRRLSDFSGIDLRQSSQRELVTKLLDYRGGLELRPERTTGVRYYYANDWFNYSDAVCLYLMMRALSPNRVTEVGCGFSSAAMLDFSQQLGLDIDFTFIDPESSRLDLLLRDSDRERSTYIDKPVQSIDPALFDILESGDILFIDSSHVTKTGSDVNYLCFEVLPRLKSGVRVHFHDVFFPFEYPEQWVYEGWGWNEAYLLRAFLQFNTTFKIEVWLSMLQKMDGPLMQSLAPTIPLLVNLEGGSIWLVRS